MPTIWLLDALKEQRKLFEGASAFDKKKKKPGTKFNPEQLGPGWLTELIRDFKIAVYYKLESLFRLHETSCESTHLNRISFFKTALHAAQSVSFSQGFPFWYIQLTREEPVCFLPLKNCFRTEAYYNTANLLNTEDACALRVLTKIFL